MDAPVPSHTPKVAVIGTIAPRLDMWSQADDWTGITSTAERKKRQNRINQRAYRRRKIAAQNPAQISPCSSAPHVTEERNEWHDEENYWKQADNERSTASVCCEIPFAKGPLLLTSRRQVAQAHDAIREAYQAYSLGAARPSHLHVLIRLNVLNSLARNAISMGFPPEGLCRDQYLSPYCEEGPLLSYQRLLSSCVPDCLRPTSLQRRIIHHPWIDLFPFPIFRDNMLHALAAGVFDEDELCHDMLMVTDPNGLADKPALISWSGSWDVHGWEASPAFLRKWGWLLWGCPEIIEGTNYWRQKRGETSVRFFTS